MTKKKLLVLGLTVSVLSELVLKNDSKIELPLWNVKLPEKVEVNISNKRRQNKFRYQPPKFG